MASKNPAKVFDSHVSASNLSRIYHDHVLDGSSRGRDGMLASALQGDLQATSKWLSQRLRSGEHNFIQYQELTYSKGAGRLPRVVSIPSARDRIALRAIADFLADVFPGSVGSLPQTTIRSVGEAVRSGTYDAYIRLDVKDFFPSISHELLRQQLRARIKRESIVSVIDRAIRTPTVAKGEAKKLDLNVGVPQGLAISNLLAELAMRPVDDAHADRADYKYFRFVDDILLLCNSDEIEALDKVVREDIEARGLVVHPRAVSGNKSSAGSISSGFSYLGYNFVPQRISVRRSSVHKLEARLAREFTKYKYSKKRDRLRVCRWHVNLAVTGCIYQGRMSGWLPYYRQLTDLQLLKQLDATVSSMSRRFGMPAGFHAKSFVRAYWSIAHPNPSRTAYLPKFDGLNVRQMREELERCLGQDRASEIEDDDVRSVFRRTMNSVVSELELDIVDVS